MAGPLDGIRVLDWSIWQMGPVGSTMLGDLGAEVIKIEDRVSGDPARAMKRIRRASVDLPEGRNLYFESNNRNKKSITLDLSKTQGREIVYRLVKRSDVFLQNFRDGVAARLGLDYETLSSQNPRLIYASGTGFGHKGPDCAAPAFDNLGLARSGIMLGVGEPDMPPLGTASAIADQLGGIMLAHGVTAALLARERLGIGQKIDVSLLGSMICLQGLAVTMWGMDKKEYVRQARHDAPNALYNHYRCGDGKWLMLAHLQGDRYWVPFCAAIGKEELATDDRFRNAMAREEHAADLVRILDNVFATKPCDEWIRILKERGDFIVHQVNSVPDLFEDEQVLANDYIVPFEHPALGATQMVGFPVQFSATSPSIHLPAPEFGEHTEEVLVELGGYSWDEIVSLREQEVI